MENEIEVHKMIHRGTTTLDEEIFECETCGRVILIRFPPDYHKTVLEIGDDYVIHVGGVGGVEGLEVAMINETLPQEFQDWLDERTDDDERT